MNDGRFGRRRSGRGQHGRGLMALAVCLAVAAAGRQPARAVTLEDLFDGGSLTAGSSQFSHWELVSLSSTADPSVDLAQITVAPLLDDPAQPGLQFVANGQLAAVGVQSIDLVLKYRVSALPGVNSFTGHELEVTSLAFTGSSGIAYVSAEAASAGGTDLGSTLATADYELGFFHLVDAAEFALPQSQFWVTMNPFVTSVTSGGNVELATFVQRFAQDGPSGLPGDYNQSGAVDAADYVTWRKHLGAPAGTLPNDVDGGVIGQAQYNTWRANFGSTFGGGSLAIAVVPEPTAMLLLAIGVGAASWRRVGRAASRRVDKVTAINGPAASVVPGTRDQAPLRDRWPAAADDARTRPGSEGYLRPAPPVE